jgi:hypothetical protein
MCKDHHHHHHHHQAGVKKSVMQKKKSKLLSIYEYAFNYLVPHMKRKEEEEDGLCPSSSFIHPLELLPPNPSSSTSSFFSLQ